MTRIGALGAAAQVEAFALAGALVFVTEEGGDIESVWDALPEDVGVLILTPAAAQLLGARLEERPQLLPVVMPE
jgi:vacuolar-type H+-ATPase subunit F/Vma7